MATNQPGLLDSYECDRRWSDQLLPEVKSILGQCLIEIGSEEMDMERCGDLVVMTLKPFVVGVRLRRNQYLRYADEFTIRAGRPSGAKTELAKIIEGWGDYFFYGFANEAEDRLVQWLLGDLQVFRHWWAQKLYRLGPRQYPGILQRNTDGSSDFLAFRLESMPDAFFIETSS